MQRVLLRWADPDNSPVEDLVTGVVVGLRGHKVGKGEFQVEDICYPELPPPGAWPGGGVTEDKYVLGSRNAIQQNHISSVTRVCLISMNGEGGGGSLGAREQVGYSHVPRRPD